MSEAQQRAIQEYMNALNSPAAQAAAQRRGEALQRQGEALQRYGETMRRWNEAIAKAEAAKRDAAEREAAEREAAEREAAEREARRRRRRRADNRRRAAQRQAAERKAAEREAAEHKAAEREAAEREAAEREAVEHNVPKQKTQRAPQRGEAQRVKMTDEDISWAEKNLSELKKGYCNLEAAVVDFERRWKEDPTRNKRKLPSRTQFIDKVWKKRTATSDSD